MFIVSLTYKAPIGQIDSELENHIAYLKEQYALGNFLASGRKVPRNGGIILSGINDRAKLDEVLQKDPFNIHGLADYEITEFIPSMACSELKFLIESR